MFRRTKEQFDGAIELGAGGNKVAGVVQLLAAGEPVIRSADAAIDLRWTGR